MKLCAAAARLVILAAGCASLSGCVSSIVRPTLSPPDRGGDALLILPGFGYRPDGENALRALAPSIAGEGIDLYVPSYISRGGLASSQAALQQFVRETRLDRYERLHVFAFIAGAWTINPLAQKDAFPNLATVVYDRSPLQERAPRIATEKFRLLTWMKYGSPVFELARTPYPPLTATDVNVGLMVETMPTRFINRHARTARAYGPVEFACGELRQRYDDCLYLAMDHDQLYVRFSEVWPELLVFIRTGRFSYTADRTPPRTDPLATLVRNK